MIAITLALAGLAAAQEQFVVLIGGLIAADDNAGTSLDVSGEYLVGGSPGRTDGAADSGGVLVWNWSADDEEWQVDTALAAVNPVASAGYGDCTSINMLSSSLMFTSVADGKVNFYRESGSWGNGQEFSSAGSGFGTWCSMGLDTAAVSAPGAGTIDVYTFDGSNWSHDETITQAGADASFGGKPRVAVNGEQAWITVGAPGQDSGDGAVFVYSKSGTWSLQTTLTPAASGNAEAFGFSVAQTGYWMAVGANDEDIPSFTAAGAVHLYQYDGSAWQYSAKLTSDTPSVSGSFGRSVDIDFDSILVGSLLRVEHYTRSGSVWSFSTELVPSTGKSGTLGDVVALSGDALCASDATSDDILSNGGAVYGWGFPTPAQTFSMSQSIDPALLGDPILIDFKGHRFLAGKQKYTKYLLYSSADDSLRLTMTTNEVLGDEMGYFVGEVGVDMAGCGSLAIKATMMHHSEMIGSPCMVNAVARGDRGMVVVPLANTGAVMAVYPHMLRDDTHPFLNLKLLKVTENLTVGCKGMLCQEEHEDIVVA